MSNFANYNDNVSVTGSESDDVIENSGRNVTISALGGNDRIYNANSLALISAGANNDTVENYGSGVTLTGYSGNDSISTYGNYNSISGGTGSDTIIVRNDSNRNTIVGGAGNDNIAINNNNALIIYSAGDGNDLIEGFNATSTLSIGSGQYESSTSGNYLILTVDDGKISIQGGATLSSPNIIGEKKGPKNITNTTGNISIVGSEFADTITNRGEAVTILGNGGNDSIVNGGRRASLVGGEGNDSIQNVAANTTIIGGKDNDNIYNTGSSVIIVYNNGDGNDIISGFNENSTLSIVGGTFTRSYEGDNLILTVGDNRISIIGGTGRPFPDIIGQELTRNIRNTKNFISVTGSEYDDVIENSGRGVSISALGGNDSINNTNSLAFISAGANNDNVENYGAGVTITGDSGNDRITGYGNYNSIVGGTGSDTITIAINGSNRNTIVGGEGNDNIAINNNNALIIYSAGDGNDFIEGFNATSSLSIGGGTFTSAISGNDLILTVDDGKISIQGGATLSSPNIIGKETGKVITNNTSNVSIVGTESNDTISNTASNVTIVARGGDDFVANSGKNSRIDGGNDNDFLHNNATNVTITGGKGNDFINNYNANNVLINYSDGDGNDSLVGMNNTSTLSIVGGQYKSISVNDTKLFIVGNGQVSIRDGNISAQAPKIIGTESSYGVNYTNEEDYVSIVATPYRDNISNYGEQVTVIPGAGNDEINYANVFIYRAGDGDDVIKKYRQGDKISIDSALSYSSVKSGTDVFLKMSDGGSITLGDAADKTLSIDGTLSKSYANFTTKGSTVGFDVITDSTMPNKELQKCFSSGVDHSNNQVWLKIFKDLKDYKINIKNNATIDLVVTDPYNFGQSTLKSGSTFDFELANSNQGHVTLTSSNFNDTLSLSKNSLLEYNGITVSMENNGTISTRAEKKISLGKATSCKITAPVNTEIEISSYSKATVNNFSIKSAGGAGTFSVTADYFSFTGDNVTFGAFDVSTNAVKENSSSTIKYHKLSGLYIINSGMNVKTSESAFQKLNLYFNYASNKTYTLDGKNYASYIVNGKQFLISDYNTNSANVIKVNKDSFKILDKALDATNISRIILDETISFCGTKIDFNGIKTTYARDKTVTYSTDGKTITLDATANVTTSSDTRNFTGAAGSYTVNGKAFTLSTTTNFTANTGKISIPLTNANAEISFDGVTVSGVSNGGNLVFDLNTNKIFIPDGAKISTTAAEDLKLNLSKGSYTVNGASLVAGNAIEISADQDEVTVPIKNNSVTIGGAKLTGDDPVIINGEGIICLPSGTLVENPGDNTYLLEEKNTWVGFGSLNKKILLTEDEAAFVKFESENEVSVCYDKTLSKSVEILGNNSWTVEVDGNGDISAITGITDGATISCENYIGQDMGFNVETDGKGTFTICEQTFTSSGSEKNSFKVKQTQEDDTLNIAVTEIYKEDGTLTANFVGGIEVNDNFIETDENSNVTVTLSDEKISAISGLNNGWVKSNFSDGIKINGSTAADLIKIDSAEITISADEEKNLCIEEIFSDTKIESSGKVTTIITGDDGNFTIGDYVYSVRNDKNGITFLKENDDWTIDDLSTSGTVTRYRIGDEKNIFKWDAQNKIWFDSAEERGAYEISIGADNIISLTAGGKKISNYSSKMIASPKAGQAIQNGVITLSNEAAEKEFFVKNNSASKISLMFSTAEIVSNLNTGTRLRIAADGIDLLEGSTTGSAFTLTPKRKNLHLEKNISVSCPTTNEMLQVTREQNSIKLNGSAVVVAPKGNQFTLEAADSYTVNGKNFIAPENSTVETIEGGVELSVANDKIFIFDGMKFSGTGKVKLSGATIELTGGVIVEAEDTATLNDKTFKITGTATIGDKTFTVTDNNGSANVKMISADSFSVSGTTMNVNKAASIKIAGGKITSVENILDGTTITGDALKNISIVTATGNGIFTIGGRAYQISSSTNEVTFTTNDDGLANGVSNLNGTISGNFSLGTYSSTVTEAGNSSGTITTLAVGMLAVGGGLTKLSPNAFSVNKNLFQTNASNLQVASNGENINGINGLNNGEFIEHSLRNSININNGGEVQFQNDGINKISRDANGRLNVDGAKDGLNLSKSGGIERVNLSQSLFSAASSGAISVAIGGATYSISWASIGTGAATLAIVGTAVVALSNWITCKKNNSTDDKDEESETDSGPYTITVKSDDTLNVRYKKHKTKNKTTTVNEETTDTYEKLGVVNFPASKTIVDEKGIDLTNKALLGPVTVINNSSDITPNVSITDSTVVKNLAKDTGVIFNTNTMAVTTGDAKGTEFTVGDKMTAVQLATDYVVTAAVQKANVSVSSESGIDFITLDKTAAAFSTPGRTINLSKDTYYSVNGVTFKAPENSTVKTATLGVEFNLVEDKYFSYGGISFTVTDLTEDDTDSDDEKESLESTATIYATSVKAITLGENALVSGKYNSSKFNGSGKFKIGDLIFDVEEDSQKVDIIFSGASAFTVAEDNFTLNQGANIKLDDGKVTEIFNVVTDTEISGEFSEVDIKTKEDGTFTINEKAFEISGLSAVLFNTDDKGAAMSISGISGAETASDEEGGASKIITGNFTHEGGFKIFAQEILTDDDKLKVTLSDEKLTVIEELDAEKFLSTDFADGIKINPTDSDDDANTDDDTDTDDDADADDDANTDDDADTDTDDAAKNFLVQATSTSAVKVALDKDGIMSLEELVGGASVSSYGQAKKIITVQNENDYSLQITDFMYTVEDDDDDDGITFELVDGDFKVRNLYEEGTVTRYNVDEEDASLWTWSIEDDNWVSEREEFGAYEITINDDKTLTLTADGIEIKPYSKKIIVAPTSGNAIEDDKITLSAFAIENSCRVTNESQSAIDIWTHDEDSDADEDELIISALADSASVELNESNISLQSETSPETIFNLTSTRNTLDISSDYSVEYADSSEKILKVTLTDEDNNLNLDGNAKITAPKEKTITVEKDGTYTVNGITFDAQSGCTFKTATGGVEFDLSTGDFVYDDITFSGAGTATITSLVKTSITLTDGAIVSGEEDSPNYFNRSFTISGSVEIGDKKFSSDTPTTVSLVNHQSEEDSSTEGFTVDAKSINIQNDLYETVDIIGGKLSTIGGVKSTAKISGSAMEKISIVAEPVGIYKISGKVVKITSRTNEITFTTDAKGKLYSISNVKGRVVGYFDKGIIINNKRISVPRNVLRKNTQADETPRLLSSNVAAQTNDTTGPAGEPVLKSSGVNLLSAANDDETTDPDFIYEFDDAEKLTTVAGETLIIDGKTFTTSKPVTFTLDDDGKILSIEKAEDDLGEIEGDFSDGIIVEGVMVKVTDSQNFVVKESDGKILLDTFVHDTFTINGKTFTTYTDETIFTLDDDGNVTAIVAENYLLDDDTYVIEGDFNDAITFNGKNFCVTGTDSTTIYMSDDEIFISIEPKGNSVEVVESGGKATIEINGAGKITVGEKIFTTSENFSGCIDVNAGGEVETVEDFVGTLSGKLGGLTLMNLTVTSDDTFSATSDGNNITEINNFANGTITSDKLYDVMINDADFYISNSEKITATVVDGAIKISDLVDGADVINLGAGVELTTKTEGKFFIGEDIFDVAGDNSVTFITNADGKVTEIVGLDAGATIQTSYGGSFTVNGKKFSAKDDGIFVGLARNSAKILSGVALFKSDSTFEEVWSHFTNNSLFNYPELTAEELAGVMEKISGGSSSEVVGDMQFTLASVEDADFSEASGRKAITLQDGDQHVKFNDAGKNVLIVNSDASGKKNIELGDGGDFVFIGQGTGAKINITAGAGNDIIFTAGNDVTLDLIKNGATKIFAASGTLTLENYDDNSGAVLLTKYDDIANAIDKELINFGNGQLSIDSAKIIFDDDEARMINFMDSDEKSFKVGFTSDKGGTLDGGDEKHALILVGNKSGDHSNGSTLLGGSGNDTIYGGADDSIDAGDGKNFVSLHDDDERSSATIALTAGRTTIDGMNNTLVESRGDKISLDVSKIKKLKLDDGNFIISGNDFNATITNADLQDGDYTTQLITNTSSGETYKVAVGGKSSTIRVTEDEDIRPNAFYGDNSAVDFTSYTGGAAIDLGGDLLNVSQLDDKDAFFDGINQLIGGEGEMIFKGSGANETLVAGKGNTSLYGDGGLNLMVGYSGDDKEGSTTFFVLGNTNNAGNIIRDFEFVHDDGYTDNSKVTADQIEIQTDNNFISYVGIRDNNLYLEVADKEQPDVVERVEVENAVDSVSGFGKDIRVSGLVAQVGTDKIFFDRFADFYLATKNNATVFVDSSLDSVNLWLDDPDTGKNFEGDIKVIDARQSNATAELAGNNNDNIIYAGTGDTSLWGGSGGNDLLVGNSGKNNFFYALGNGNDTIQAANSGDVINLLDITLEQISDTNITADLVTIKFTDGGSLTIDGTADVTYHLADGSKYSANHQQLEWTAGN